MSTATAAPDAGAAPAKGGKKKLFIIIGAVVALLLVAGGGAVFYLKSKAAAAAAAEEGGEADAPKEKKPKAAAHARDPKHPPTFVPLDPFTVNLADRDAERFAQVGVSLELEDAAQGEAIKTYMPVIRNNILMVLAHKTSTELLQRDGKEKLAREIQRETARALGVEVDDEDADEEAKPGSEEKPKKKKKKKKSAAQEMPVTAVHFSNFIIQ